MAMGGRYTATTQGFLRRGGCGASRRPPLGVCLFLSLFAVCRRFSLQPSCHPAVFPLSREIFSNTVPFCCSQLGTWRQMIGVGVRRVVLARGELDKLEGTQYAARRAELRREAGKAARARDRQAAVAMQNEAGESGATEEEATGGRTSRVGRPRGGMRVAARIGDRLRREIRRGRRPRVGDG